MSDSNGKPRENQRDQRGGNRNGSRSAPGGGRRTPQGSRRGGGGSGRPPQRGRNSSGGGGPRSQGRPAPQRNATPAPQVSATRDLGLTAWDLARTRKQLPDTARGHVMTLRTHQRIAAAFESERKIPEKDRSFLRIQENAKASVLFIPGVSSGPGDLHELADRMSKSGFNVFVVRLPFHGTGGGTISGVPWKSSLNQVQQEYQLLARGGGKVHVVGMGFGSALALHLAALENVASLVLMAPALIPRESLFQRLLVRMKLHRLPWVHRWLGWNADHIEGMDQARGKVGKLRVPVFAAQCEDDDRACPTSLRFLQRKSRHQASRFRVFPEGGHAILEAHGTDTLYADILAFCGGDS